MRIIWFTLGGIALIAGIIGIFLPLLPTVPFFLLAAFFFGKSSTWAHNWLIEHPTFGPEIQNWRDNGAISRKSKKMAAVSMIAVIGIAFMFSLPIYVIAIQVAVLATVSVFIWTRPDA